MPGKRTENSMKKLLSVLIALLMAMSIMPAGLAKHADVMSEEPINAEAVRTNDSSNAVDLAEIVTVMVRLKDAPVAARMDDVRSEKAQDLAKQLQLKQQAVLEKISKMTDSSQKLKPSFSYTTLYNGFAIDVPMGLITKINELPEVERAYIAPEFSAPQPVETEPDRLSTSVGYINADDAWAAGYSGKGTTIAIVDSGAVVAHNAFRTPPEDQKLTSDSITTILRNNNMQAERLYSGTLSSNSVYYSGKIPFKFDYAGKDTDVSHWDCGTDHGSHVAGIAGGSYAGSANTGVAKDAQLVIMKVFGNNGGAAWSTILAALEDCVYLGVDAVNLSLGSACGYTSEDPYTDQIYGMLTDHGINIAAAVGNDGSSNGTQYYGSSYSSYALAMNPDNGIAGAPSTYTECLSVACSQRNASDMVFFSCHGPTPDLKLKPEIAAPGYNINSVRDVNLSGATTTYGQMSGTSMSSPHIAGAMAIVTNYVSEVWPNLTGRAKSDMVNRLLMSTANPIAATSPRAQGAGIVDVQKAITSNAYITVNGCSRPKLELGDDPAKTGVYTLSFNIVNYGNTSLSYTARPTILTENATAITMNGQNTYRFSNSYRNITSNCTITGSTNITVPANSTRTVTLTVRLNDAIKNTLDTQFVNGIYIDGFVVLDGNVDLTIPFLAFYGNWNRASVFDRYSYIDQINGENHFNIHTYQTQIGAMRNTSSYMLFGVNPYITTNDWFADRCTLSPNGDKYYDQIDRIVYDLIRNSGEGGIKIYNENNPSTVYEDIDISYMPKAWSYPNGNPNAQFYHTSDELIRNNLFTSWAPRNLAENTHIVFKLYHYLDYPGFTPEQNECSEIVLPMTIDTTAPQITASNLSGGTLRVSVRDNHYAAWIGVYSNASCTNLIAERAITEYERGKTTDLTINVGNYNTVYVKVGDYGHNTSGVTTINGSANPTATPVPNPTATPVPNPTAAPGGTSYVEVSSPAVGDKVVVVINGYAVGNTIYSNNHYLTAKAVTVNSNGTLTIPSSVTANDILWTVGGSASAGWTFRNVSNSKYMGLDSTEYLAPTNTSVAWKYENGDLNNQIDSEGYYYLSLSSAKTYFTTSKSGNGSVKMYRLVQGGAAPTATPRPTNTPAPTATPRPTNTPAPTATPRPTNTPAPNPTANPGGASYVEVSSPAVGDKVVVVINGYAVGNTIYSNNHYLTAKAVTVNSNGTLTIPASVTANDILWTVGGSASAGWTFRNVSNSKYMGLDSSEYLAPTNTSVAWKYQNGDLNNQIDSAGYYYLALSSSKTYFTTSKSTNGSVKMYRLVENGAAPTPAVTATPRPTNTPAPTATPTSAPVSDSYVEVSAPVWGEKHIVVINGYAVGNTIYSNNHYLTAKAVTVNSNGTLTIPASVNASDILWTVGGNATSGWTFRNVSNSKYMGLDSSEYLAPTNTSLAWKYENGNLNNQIDSAGYYYLALSSSKTYFTTSKNGSGSVKLYRLIEGNSNIIPSSPFDRLPASLKPSLGASF